MAKFIQRPLRRQQSQRNHGGGYGDYEEGEPGASDNGDDATSFGNVHRAVVTSLTLGKDEPIPVANITDFPLIWRWTSPTHALFSPSELAGLHPCSAVEAARIDDESRHYLLPTGLDPQYFTDVHARSAETSLADGSVWLQAQVKNTTDQVTVLWNSQTALRTSWVFFASHWDDFCYPLSDEVLVLPDDRSWILFYHHEETFFFGYRNVSKT